MKACWLYTARMDGHCPETEQPENPGANGHIKLTSYSIASNVEAQLTREQ